MLWYRSKTYIITVSLPNDSDSEITKDIVVGADTYNALKVGDSVNATVYVNKTDNSLVSLHLNKPLYVEK